MSITESFVFAPRTAAETMLDWLGIKTKVEMDDCQLTGRYYAVQVSRCVCCGGGVGRRHSVRLHVCDNGKRAFGIRLYANCDAMRGCTTLGVGKVGWGCVSADWGASTWAGDVSVQTGVQA